MKQLHDTFNISDPARIHPLPPIKISNHASKDRIPKTLLSNPSKMPGRGWSIPAQECNAGGKLRKVKGSVCEGCYAMKNRYSFDNVQNAMYSRLAHWRINRRQWIKDMVLAIEKSKVEHFRWFDSGDLQGPDMLADIVKVCAATPAVKHWLPTREYHVVKNFTTRWDVPQNLIIRLSAMMVNGPAPLAIAKQCGPSVQTSRVSTKTFNCPAPSQGNSCGDCRKCWSRSVSNITYHKH